MPSSDFSLVLSQDNGSLPPPHRRSTHATLGADGHLRVTRNTGYSGDGLSTDKALDPSTVETIETRLRGLGLFTTAWEKPELPRVGGSSRRLKVTAGGESTEIPYIVRKEQVEARNHVFACIWEMLDLDSFPYPERPTPKPDRDA